MNCSECEQHLHHQLDGPVRMAAPGLEHHLAECVRCRELHQAARLLEVGLRARSTPLPAANLADRIVGRVLAERRHQRLRRVVHLALAATVALVLLPLSRQLAHQFPSTTTPEPVLVRVEEKAHAPPAPHAQSKPQEQKAASAPSLSTKVEKAQEVLTAWSSRLAEQTREKAQVFMQAAPAVPMPPMGVPMDGADEDVSLDRAVHSLQEAGSGVTTGFRTVTGSAERAVHLFAQELSSLKTCQ